MSDHEVQKRRALTALLGVTVVWGWTFVWMKQALDLVTLTLGPEGEDAAIGMFLTIRFGLAALLLPLFLPSCRRRENWSMGLVVSGGSLGALLLTGFLLQMTALTTVSPAVSAFLTSLYVIFTAFLSLFFAQHRSISKALFAGSGSEANDTAILLATSYRKSNQVLAMRNSYHGRSHTSQAITAQSSWSMAAMSGLNDNFIQGGYRLRSPFRDLDDDAYTMACVAEALGLTLPGASAAGACALECSLSARARRQASQKSLGDFVSARSQERGGPLTAVARCRRV